MPSLDAIPNWVWWALTIGSVVTFVGSLFVLRWLIIRMPPDYFVSNKSPVPSWAGHHPVTRVALQLIKNGIGAALVGLGLLMLFTPGQGILAILVGLSMLNLPGKRRIERRIVSNPVVLRALNSMRARAGRSPLKVPRMP